MKKLILIISVLLIAIIGCRKVEKLEENLVTVTDENVSVGIDNAIINASYSYNYELKSVELIYSKDAELNNPESKEADYSNGNIHVILDNLKPKTLYYYQFKFYSGINYMTSDIQSFTTLFKDDVPMVVTGEVTNITATSAVCSGEVISDGNLTVTQRGICWCFHPKPSIDEGSYSYEGSGLGTFESVMNSLIPNTTYYARAYAINADGVAYGEDRVFITLSE